MNINTLIVVLMVGVTALTLTYSLYAYFDIKRLMRRVYELESDLLNLRVFTEAIQLNLHKYISECARHTAFQSLNCRPALERFMRGVCAQEIPADVKTFSALYQYVKVNGCPRPAFSAVFTWFSCDYLLSPTHSTDRKVLKNMLVVLWLHVVVSYRKHPNFNLLRNAYMSRFDLDDDDLY